MAIVPQAQDQLYTNPPPIQVIAQYEKAVILRLGCIRKGGAAGPGLFTYLPCVDEIHVVDMRTISFDVPPQEVGGCPTGV